MRSVDQTDKQKQRQGKSRVHVYVMTLSKMKETNSQHNCAERQTQTQLPQAIWIGSHHLQSLKTRRERGHQRTQQKEDDKLPQYHLQGRACRS